jgi:ectoine hydroxylase-related dioxygenase (phytanoyl-CoA dioxygenase family)
VPPQEDGRGTKVQSAHRATADDNNPPHRDVWLDHLRDAVNVYIPIAGSTDASSLPLVPGSHHWKESEIERTQTGARMGEQVYTVPCITAATRELTFVRPNPGPNEVLVFSPYLIHGGGVNFQGNMTRASLEARFWRVP